MLGAYKNVHELRRWDIEISMHNDTLVGYKLALFLGNQFIVE